MDGGVSAGASKSGGVLGWLGDHGMGLVKGIGAGLIGAAVVVGVAALVVGAGAPLLIMGGAAVLGGAIYGALVGSKNFNWTEAIVGSVIGGVSAGVGSWIAGTGSSLLTRAAVAAVDMVGGGLANTASYLIHEPNPTLGGAAAAFGIGAGTAAAFMGAGAVVSKGWKWAKGALGFGGGMGKNTSKTGMVEAAIGDGPVNTSPDPAIPVAEVPGSSLNVQGELQTPVNSMDGDLKVGTATPEPAPQTAPEVVWPPNRGFHGTPWKETLRPGTRIDRYGSPRGTFTSPEGTPFEARALPAEYATTKPYHVYEVVKPFEATTGLIEPWFDQPGMGIQYELPASVLDLIKSGFLREVK